MKNVYVEMNIDEMKQVKETWQIHLKIYARKLRRLKNISQTEFAEMLDISVSALSKIERGVNSPRVITAEAIAEHLDISLGRLLSSKNTADKQDYIDEIIEQISVMDVCDIESIIEFVKLYNKRKEAILTKNK